MIILDFDNCYQTRMDNFCKMLDTEKVCGSQMDLKYARLDVLTRTKWFCFAELATGAPTVLPQPPNLDAVTDGCAEPSPRHSGRSHIVRCFAGKEEGDKCDVHDDLDALTKKPCPGKIIVSVS